MSLDYGEYASESVIEYDRQDHTPATFSPMNLSQSSMVYTGRTTHCDIISVINTSSAQRIVQQKSPLSSPTSQASATLPYKKTTPRLGATLTADTPWTKLQLSKTQRERNAQLLQERDSFMADLMMERYDQEWHRHHCATRIQSVFRGFRRRPRTLQQYELKRGNQRRAQKTNSVQGIQEELCALAKILQLRTITGLTLVPQSLQTKRRRKISAAAALRIQRFFQMIVARNKARGRMGSLALNRRILMVKRIVRFFKFCFLKSFRRKALLVKQAIAAVRMQNRARAFLARRFVRLIKRSKLVHNRQNHASTIITRNYRPFVQRRILGREVPMNDMADETLRKVLDLVFEAQLSLLVEHEARESLVEEIASRVAEVVFATQLQELLDGIFDKEVDTYIEEQVRLLEEIRRQMEEERLNLERERLRLEEEMEKSLRADEERKRQEAETLANQAEVRMMAGKARIEAEQESRVKNFEEGKRQGRAQQDVLDQDDLDQEEIVKKPEGTWQERIDRAKTYHRFGRYAVALGTLSRLLVHGGEQVGDDEGAKQPHRKATVAVLSGGCYANLGQYKEAMANYELARGICAEVVELRNPLLAEILIGMAAIHQVLGRYTEAALTFKEAFAILEEADAQYESPRAKEDTTSDEALVRRQFCAFYVGVTEMHMCLGNYSLAENAIDSLLHFIEDRYSRDEVEGKDMMSNCLAAEAALFAAQGLVQDTVAAHNEVLEMRRATYGEEHPVVAASLTQLGISYTVMNNLQEAARCIDAGLSMRLKFLHPQSLEVAESLYAKARYLAVSGQYGVAIACMQQALTMRTTALGPSHHLVAQALHGLADITTEMGLPVKAGADYKSALSIRRECFSSTSVSKAPVHKSIVESGLSLGLNVLACGRYLEAASLLEQSVRDYEDLLPSLLIEAHWEAEVCKVALAKCCCHLGQLERSKALLSPASSALLDVFGGKSLLVAEGLLVMANICALQGLFKDAEVLLDKALKMQIAVLGESSPRLMATYTLLCLNLLGPGNYDEAVAAISKGLDILSTHALDVPHSIHFLFLLHARAQILRESGFFEDAMPLYEQALVGFRAMLGSENSTWFSLVLGDLAECLRLQGNLERADVVLHEALRLRIAQYGEAHTYVADTRRSIALLLLDRRQPGEALKVLREDVLPVLVAAFGTKNPSVVYTMGITGLCLRSIESPESPEAQPLLDDALDFLDTYEHGRFSDVHPWVLRLGGFVSPNASRASTAMPSSRLPRALALICVGATSADNESAFVNSTDSPEKQSRPYQL